MSQYESPGSSGHGGGDDAKNTNLPSNKRSLGIAFLTIFLDLLGFGIIIPIQPFYAESLGASPTVVTLLGASYSLMQFLFAPFWGRLSDRVGRRPVILTSVFIGFTGYIFFGFAGSLWSLFVARALSGFGNANIGTAQALIADVTDIKERAKGMGLIGAAFGLGFIFGPAIGGGLGQWGPQAPIFFAASLGALNFIVAYLWLPETLHQRPPNARSPHIHEKSSWRTTLDTLSHPQIGTLLIITLIVTTGFALLEQVLSLFIERVWLGYPPADIAMRAAHFRKAAALTSYALVIIGVCAAVLQGVLLGRLARRFGEHRLLLTGLILLAVAMACFPLLAIFKSFAGLLLASVILAIGTGLATPTRISLLSLAAKDGEMGSVLGLNQSLAALGRVLGPAVAGILFEWQISAPFYIGAGMVFIAVLLGLRLFWSQRLPTK